MKQCNFEDAFAWAIQFEGKVLELDPNDPGGMTLWGISRKFNPNAEFWTIIDKQLMVNSIQWVSGYVLNQPDLVASIKTWYYTNIYLKNSLDSLEWQLGIQVFDAHVNLGHRAVGA